MTEEFAHVVLCELGAIRAQINCISLVLRETTEIARSMRDLKGGDMEPLSF